MIFRPRQEVRRPLHLTTIFGEEKVVLVGHHLGNIKAAHRPEQR